MGPVMTASPDTVTRAACVAVLLLLGACGPTENQKKAVQQSLPRGCSVLNLGQYGSINNLVVVICDGRPTTSTNYRENRGKYSAQQAALWVGEPQ